MYFGHDFKTTCRTEANDMALESYVLGATISFQSFSEILDGLRAIFSIFDLFLETFDFRTVFFLHFFKMLIEMKQMKSRRKDIY